MSNNKESTVIELEKGSKIITIESGTNIISKPKLMTLAEYNLRMVLDKFKIDIDKLYSQSIDKNENDKYKSEEQYMKELVEIFNNSPRLDTINVNFPSELFPNDISKGGNIMRDEETTF